MWYLIVILLTIVIVYGLTKTTRVCILESLSEKHLVIELKKPSDVFYSTRIVLLTYQK